MRDLSLPIRYQTHTSSIERFSLNYWTTRKVLSTCTLDLRPMSLFTRFLIQLRVIPILALLFIDCLWGSHIDSQNLFPRV